MFHHLLPEWGRAGDGERYLPRAMGKKSCLEIKSISAKRKHGEGVRPKKWTTRSQSPPLSFKSFSLQGLGLDGLTPNVPKSFGFTKPGSQGERMTTLLARREMGVAETQK